MRKQTMQRRVGRWAKTSAVYGAIVLVVNLMGIDVTQARPSMGGAGGGGGRPSGGGGGRPSGGARPSGGGGARPSGGGGARPSAPRPSAPRPNTSRPSTPNNNMSRPSMPNVSRPSPPMNRPSTGNLGGNYSPSGGRPSTRPSTPSTRPSVTLPSNNVRPNPPTAGMGKPSLGGGGGAGKPSLGGGGAGKPSLGGGGAGKPSLGGGAGKPSIGTGLERPTTLPGNVGRPSGKPGLGDGPNLGRPDRPGGGSGPGIATRPSLPSVNDRPGQWPGGGRPGDGRPGDRPVIGGRPGGPGGIGGPGRPGGIGGGNNIIGGGNTIIGGGNNINVNRPGWGVNPGFVNRPGNQWNDRWQNNWHNHCIPPRHRGWYHGCWTGRMWGNFWYAPLAFGATAWGLGAVNAGYGYGDAYANPYYEPVAEPAYDYSQPVVINNYVSSDATGGAAQATAETADSEAVEMFDAALAAFKSGDYASALSRCDNALKQLPSDPVIHEVRALSLFALGKYQPSAAALNSLLASAPGMSWTTMSGLYGESDDYTKQLRALESHLRANPKDASARFVLAYHYLVLDESEAAIKALKLVVEQQPDDNTAKRMLDALTSSDEQTETPAKPTPEDSSDAPPATDLVGAWTAKASKTTVALTLDEDSNFVWRATTPGQDAQEIKGTAETTSDTLSLTSDDTEQGIMAGKVQSQGPDKFTFRFAGAPSSDPGLEFTRVK